MTMIDGISPLHISKTRLLIQYAGSDIPDMSCICFKLYYLSLRMNDITTDGIKAKPIETTKAMKIPLAVAARCLNF